MYTYEYPRPALTVDMIIICKPQRKVLLIQRGHEPFKGYWAIPGGYVEEGETIIAAARRELQEETGITGVDLQQVGTYGDPGRDPRGWQVTVAHVGYVSEMVGKAGDDAAAAHWFDFGELPELAVDHAIILQDTFKKINLQ